jgi:hypothetical protein
MEPKRFTIPEQYKTVQCSVELPDKSIIDYENVYGTDVKSGVH